MVKKRTKQAIVILACLFLCAIIVLGDAGVDGVIAYAAENISVARNLFAAENSGDDDAVFLSDDASSDSDVTYLSDLEYYSANTEKSRPVIKDAVDTNGTKIQIKIEGSWYEFDKGLFTHTGGTNATATVTVIYNLEDLDYDYFTTYIGMNRTATKGDGVRFNIGKSKDGKTWEWWVQGSPEAMPPQSESQFVTIDLRGGYKWLQLWANRGSGNAHDHAVWADAKLTNSLDEGGAVNSVQTLDVQLKGYGVNADLSDPTVEKLILQREFVSRVGQYALKRFTEGNEEDVNNDNKAMLDWLYNDLDSLREFIMGGAPFGGSYFNSLTVLSDLYKHYKDDLTDPRPLKYNAWNLNRTYGQLYRTMMFSVALTHDKTIGSYLQGSRVENQSDPLRRYAIYRYMYETERFVALRDANGKATSETMSLFGSLKVEEMRWIMSNIIDDESIIWLNDYVQTRINANKAVGNLYTPHSYVKYTDPNYNNPVFYANENYDYFNQLFAVDGRDAYFKGVKVESNAGKKIGLWDTEYVVPGGYDPDTDTTNYYTIKVSRSAEGEAKLQKVWMNFRNKFGTGSVCGGISKSGCNIRGSRGIPANVIGQPGHAAILYYRKDANGNGSWAIDNDVGGWVAATKNERHLLGWGNAAWQRNSGGGGTVVFFHLAQECLNDYDNFVKAEEYTFLANTYKGEPAKQEALYEKALTAQAKNLDAWYGLVQAYKAQSSKTAANLGGLVKRIGDTLFNHPLAMHCLFRLFLVDKDNKCAVDEQLASPVFNTQLKTVELDALNKAKTSGSTAAKVKANLILGATDTSVADFSFDGANAGSIVWSSNYDGSGFTWKYSLDGKKSWSEDIVFTGDEAHVHELSQSELSSISEDTDIYVYIIGSSPDNAYRIDVSSKPALPNNLYANDWENRVIGVDDSYEWRYRTGEEDNYTYSDWKAYAEEKPDCTGDKVIEVRIKGTAKNPASDARAFQFTADKDTDARKYVSVEHLTLIEYSTQSQDAKRPNYAVNSIDGNAYTYWHTDYAVNLKKPGVDENGNAKPYAPAYLIFKLDSPRNISALEFVQYQYNASFSIFAKSAIVYVSVDGENWIEAGKRDNFENIDDLKAIHFAKSVYGQYVKLVLQDLYETNVNDGVFTTVSMINIYEDTTIALPAVNKDPSGSNAGLWIALTVVFVLLLNAAAVFVLYKRGILKFKNEKATAEGSNPKTDTAKPRTDTAKAKANTNKPKADTAKPKTDTAKPKANAATPKANATTPKTEATAAKSKADTTKPKTDTAKSKADTAKPKTDTAKSKANATATKANATTSKSKADGTTSKANAATAKSKANTTTSKATATKPKSK